TTRFCSPRAAHGVQLLALPSALATGNATAPSTTTNTPPSGTTPPIGKRKLASLLPPPSGRSMVLHGRYNFTSAVPDPHPLRHRTCISVATPCQLEAAEGCGGGICRRRSQECYQRGGRERAGGREGPFGVGR